MFLALGSTFCTKQPPKLHDYIFDAKQFCRKLAWCAFHEDRKRKLNAQDPVDTELRELFLSDDETSEFFGFESENADLETTLSSDDETEFLGLSGGVIDLNYLFSTSDTDEEFYGFH